VACTFLAGMAAAGALGWLLVGKRLGESCADGPVHRIGCTAIVPTLWPGAIKPPRDFAALGSAAVRELQSSMGAPMQLLVMFSDRLGGDLLRHQAVLAGVSRPAGVPVDALFMIRLGLVPQ
jgi:hypothetical protein